MKTRVLLMVLLFSFGLPLNIPAQNPIPPEPVGTPLPISPQATATPIPRVPFTTDEDIQPPTDGPAVDSLGFIGTPKDAPTPVNLETMQATLTVWMTNTPTSPVGLNPQPTATPNPPSPTPQIEKTATVQAAVSPATTASPAETRTTH
jgi:hypothetical protein